MIMRHELFPEEAMERLAPVVDAESASLPYLETDVEGESLPGPLRDCLRALHRCRGRGWIRFADGGDDGFDPEEYAYFDNPLNADLHELVPGRLLVSSCPRSLPGGAAWADRYDAAGRFLARDFSPAYAADHLAQFDAALCVRVGVPRYGPDALAGTGIRLLDLYCEEDVAAPPPGAVVSFLEAIDAAAPRPVALQGDGLLWPAFALAGAYLVRREGFTAEEAAAWLRMVRPGCVTREHLPFLRAQAREAAADAAASAPFSRRTASAAAAPSECAAAPSEGAGKEPGQQGLRRSGSMAGVCDRGAEAVTGRL